jgi:hypothetical protein
MAKGIPQKGVQKETKKKAWPAIVRVYFVVSKENKKLVLFTHNKINAHECRPSDFRKTQKGRGGGGWGGINTSRDGEATYQRRCTER